MPFRSFWKLAALCIAVAALGKASAHPPSHAPVNVHVVDRHGRFYAEYPAENASAARWSTHSNTHRSYVEAKPGGEYGIRVTNRTSKRIGIVIAVDGRNIIDGSHSELAGTEAMYVLGPYESNLYGGWRISAQSIRRFYFTNPPDAYAARIGDRSAMGVIALATFEEQERKSARAYREKRRFAAPTQDTPPTAPLSTGKATRDAGTGFGRGAVSHSTTVAFVPQSRPRFRHFLKYEWRERLVELGVIGTDRNRLWPDERAPAPPRFVPAPPPRS